MSRGLKSSIAILGLSGLAIWYLREHGGSSTPGLSLTSPQASRPNVPMPYKSSHANDVGGHVLDSAAPHNGSANADSPTPDAPDGEAPVVSHEEAREATGFSWAKGVDPRGIPFPVSDSVIAACAKISHLQHGSCRDHEAALSQMAKEGRDEAWALAMEDAIASQVKSQPHYFIRALDCRTTVCAVEIESTLGVFDRKAPERLKDVLVWVDTISGYERSSSSQLVTVTSMSFRRK